MLRYTIAIALLASVALCSAAAPAKQAEQDQEILNFAKGLESLSDEESAMLDAWVGNLILDQKRGGVGGLPTRFLNRELEGLETTVKHLPLGWIESGQEPASHEEISTKIVAPCESVLSKLESAAEAYRATGDGTYLYGLVYVDMCKSVVEYADQIEGQIAKGAADDAQEEAEASVEEPIEDSFEGLQINSPPPADSEESEASEHEVVGAEVVEPSAPVSEPEVVPAAEEAETTVVQPEVDAPVAVEAH